MSDTVAAGSTTSSAPTSSGGVTSTSAPSAGGSKVTSTGQTSAAPATQAQPGQKRTLADQVGGKAPAQESQTPAEQTAAKNAEIARKLKMQFKVDGKEWEEELSEDEIKIRLQKAHAAEKRMQEAAEYRKKWNEAVAYGKENPREAFKQLFGVDFDELAEKRIEERFNEAMLPEHEREKLELQRKIEQYEKQERMRKEQYEAHQKQQFEQQVWEETERDFLTALDGFGYEKKFARTVLLPMMADIAEANLEYNIELDPKTMAAQVQKRLDTIANNYFSGLDGDALLERLGEEQVKKIIQAQLAKVQLRQPKPEQPVAPEPKDAAPQKKPGLSPSQFRKKYTFGL